ncbi:MAG: NAD(P)H-hydrate dehydratase [Methylococcaceae bacterium]
MRNLPAKLYRSKQVKELDRTATEDNGISAIVLMRRAGEAAFKQLQETFPKATTVAIFCGQGNNGGDGYIVAKAALAAGMKVQVFSVAPVDELHGTALAACEELIARGGVIIPYTSNLEFDADVAVDALLGMGLDRDVTGLYAEVIKRINNKRVRVMSLDIPSGIDADTGNVRGIAIKADITISFVGLKQGLFTGDAVDHCGFISFDDLGIPNDVYEKTPHSTLKIDRPFFSKRQSNTHKGQYGHVLVIGGDHGFTGAARMAANAAARVGAGLVSIATREKHAPFINLDRPELMSHGVESEADLAPLIEKASVIVIGPGLGLDDWGSKMFYSLVGCEKPMIIDADALTALSKESYENDKWILTPHPGEAARLLSQETTEIESDRFLAARKIQQKFGGVCVLKGAGTLVDDGQNTYLCSTGNPGMSSGGMGDVLAGILAGLVAQDYGLSRSSQMGTYIHGLAGDKAGVKGQRGMLASDLMTHLRTIVNNL